MSSTANELYWFYVLLCSDGTFYGGYTTDPDRREAEHNFDDKLGAKYTRTRRPVHRIYQTSFSTRHDALSAEAKFKRLSRRQKEKFLRARGAVW